MDSFDPIAQIAIVLHRPQKVVNIAGVVRAMKNMGLRQLRLVQPGEFDPTAILGMAHRSEDVLAEVVVYQQLDAALADAIYVVGATARVRDMPSRVVEPRALAPVLLARATMGVVAVVFGPEDNGLTNAELDRCHTILTIPTVATYASLNLAQAVLLVAYELRMACGAPCERARRVPPAHAAALEGVFAALEQALWGVDFFKANRARGIMRTLRSLIHRAEPDMREAALLRAIAMEVMKQMKRTPSSQ